MALPDDHRKQLARLFIIANRLEEGGQIKRQDLLKACGCSLRTINRDLKLLKEAGVACQFDDKSQTYILKAPLPFQSVQFSLAEIMALAIAQEALLTQSGLPFVAALRSAFARITNRVPPRFKEALLNTRQAISFGSNIRRDYSQAPWQELADAATRRETVRMHYHNLRRKQQKFREVDPYRVTERNGYLILVGYCHDNHTVRDFALDRIRNVQPTGAKFTMLADFDLDEYLEGSVGTWRGELTHIVVRFEPEMAPYARQRQWEFPCQLEDGPEGSLFLRGTVSGTEGIRTELLSWGAGVEVLEPLALRERMRQEGEAIAARHR